MSDAAVTPSGGALIASSATMQPEVPTTLLLVVPAEGLPGRRELSGHGALFDLGTSDGSIPEPVPSRSDGRRLPLGGVRAVVSGVRRNRGVHLLESTSAAAATAALAAWIFHRPMVVTLPAAGTDASRRRRPPSELLRRLVEGWIVRACLRVSVTDSDTLDRMLGHGVEASRLSLVGADAPIVWWPSDIVVGPPAGTTPTTTTPIRRRDPDPNRLLALSVVACLAVAATVGLIFGPLAHQWSLSVHRQADRQSDLFFPRPLSLPSRATSGSSIPVTFAITNRAPSVTDYRWSVTESSGGRTVPVLTGHLSVPAGRVGTRSVSIPTAARPGPDEIEVRIEPSGLFAFFHVTVQAAA